MSIESEDLQVQNFIDEWLNHWNLTHKKSVEAISEKLNIDYILPCTATGILVSDWKKPFSVQALNKALRAYDELNLSELIIISRQVSEHALDTIQRIKINISVIHPLNLSELAMKFVNVSKYEAAIAV